MPKSLAWCIRRGSSAWAGNAFTGSGRQSSLNRAGTTGLAGTTQLSRFAPWDYLSPPARLGADLIRVQRVREDLIRCFFEMGQIHGVILILFQDETNNATLSSWQDHEEPMSSWSHPLGRLCSKPRTSGNSGKPWRC